MSLVGVKVLRTFITVALRQQSICSARTSTMGVGHRLYMCRLGLDMIRGCFGALGCVAPVSLLLFNKHRHCSSHNSNLYCGTVRDRKRKGYKIYINCGYKEVTACSVMNVVRVGEVCS